MNPCLRVLLSTFALVAVLAPFETASRAANTPSEQAGAEWKQISDDDNVLVYSKEIPGSDVIAFRGEGVIDASVAKVAQILIDTPRKLEWVAKIAEARTIREIGFLDRIEYNHTSSGFFLVRDRDFVFHAKGDVDCKSQKLVFHLKSVEDSTVPETDNVRGFLNASEYSLTAIEGGKKTRVIVEIHADPKGSVPKWLVNLFQKSWPRKTMEGMRQQVAKPDVRENPEVAAALVCKAK